MSNLPISMFSPKQQTRCAAIDEARHKEIVEDEDFDVELEMTPKHVWSPQDFLTAGESGSKIDVVRRGSNVLAFIAWKESKDSIMVQRLGVDPTLTPHEQHDLVRQLVEERPEKMRGGCKSIVAVIPETDLLVMNALKDLGYKARGVERNYFGPKYLNTSLTTDGVKLTKDFKAAIKKVTYMDLESANH